MFLTNYVGIFVETKTIVNKKQQKLQITLECKHKNYKYVKVQHRTCPKMLMMVPLM